MTLEQHLNDYHRLELPNSDLGFYTKAGLRGSGATQLFGNVQARGRTLDASATAGLVLAGQLGHLEEGVVLESSRAALRCAEASFAKQAKIQVAAGSLFDIGAASFDTLFLAPQTDKGNLRVEAELAGAAYALRGEGEAYVLLHKNQGAKRYEKKLRDYFADTQTLTKSQGWRLTRAWGAKESLEPPAPLCFEAAGLTLQSERGVYAAGKLDPGTQVMLEALELSPLLGKRVLDIGCGYGILALKAALAGADVTALDDDLAAIRSAYKNALRYALDIRFLHSDVNSALPPDARFDAVLSNPPFHVGKQVRLELPTAFIAAAYQHLKPGGTFTLVANAALPYEPLLNAFESWTTLATNKQFKVLQARK